MPVCAFVSFRLGLSDGVSVVARNWQRAMEQLGFDTLTVAGEGPVDRTVTGLQIGAPSPPDHAQLDTALSDADLVVVENLCSIPLNLAAARATASVLHGRPAILHHHDPPWQRPRFAHITELPPLDQAWRHVTINRLTVREMAERGIEARCIYNGFPVTTAPGERAGVRGRFGIAPDTVLIAHPVRAIPRKDVAAAVQLAEQLNGTYWLWGPAEDGYAHELDAILDRARCPIVRGTAGESASDLYSAADAIVFPSTWEGFGNPPIEAAIHRVPAAVGPYPVKAELVALGMRWFPTDDPEPLRQAITNPDIGLLEHNREVALRHFSLEVMRDAIGALLDDAGWLA